MCSRHVCAPTLVLKYVLASCTPVAVHGQTLFPDILEFNTPLASRGVPNHPPVGDGIHRKARMMAEQGSLPHERMLLILSQVHFDKQLVITQAWRSNTSAQHLRVLQALSLHLPLSIQHWPCVYAMCERVLLDLSQLYFD